MSFAAAIPAKAGTHLAAPVSAEPWVPAFAGNAVFNITRSWLPPEREPI